MTTAISVLAFTVVLAEAFLAVGLSTVVPAAFVEMCRVIRAMMLATTVDNTAIDLALDHLMEVAPMLPGMPGPLKPGATDADKEARRAALKPYKDAVRELVKTSDKLQLLVPKSASIDAEFACSGGETYSANAGLEGVIQVVGVKAGYSALFEMKSSTSVRLHVDFAPVEYSL
jgi:hypothetical protein